ncbi:class I SAM-dependent methyltransferase [Aerococcaceae bacterium NML191219]|nr:class I SAM-dependent methyltransferase [Aerococcaceae bacterium NML191219]
MQRALHYSHTLLKEAVQQFPQGVFVDGTLGKGNDLHLIMSQPDFVGRGYGFDIQETAIQLSQEKLANYPNAVLVHDSHDTIDRHLAHESEIHGAIYNLGYLPGGDHTITTNFDSTIRSIHQVAAKLAKKARILLVVYSGHPEGQVEKERLFAELKMWPQEQFQVLQYEFINQRNHPPMLLVVERV